MQLRTTHSSEKRYKAMTPEQFAQVVDAISQGRYSWACVLILRFVGHNPLHFIPYRTYSRLVKESRLLSQSSELQNNQLHVNKSLAMTSVSHAPISQCLTQIHDLNHLETANQQEDDLRGGYLPPWVMESMKECPISKLEWLEHQRANFWLDINSRPS